MKHSPLKLPHSNNITSLYCCSLKFGFHFFLFPCFYLRIKDIWLIDGGPDICKEAPGGKLLSAVGQQITSSSFLLKLSLSKSSFSQFVLQTNAHTHTTHSYIDTHAQLLLLLFFHYISCSPLSPWLFLYFFFIS